MIRQHISGKLTITPDINYQKRKKADRSKLISVAKGDFFGQEIEFEIESKYDSNNNITRNGTILRSQVKTRLRNLFHSIYRSDGNNICFWTFTLPTSRKMVNGVEAFQPDSFYVSRFSMLLENLRKRRGLSNYVWVAERQLKNDRGAIHFHCVFEAKFIDVQMLAKYWSSLLSEYHYASKSCVDIKKIYNVKKLANYVSAYISKSDAKIYARPWGASRDWSRLSTSLDCVQELSQDQFYSICEIDGNVIFKQVKAIENTNLEITSMLIDTDFVFNEFFRLNYYKKRKKLIPDKKVLPVL